MKIRPRDRRQVLSRRPGRKGYAVVQVVYKVHSFEMGLCFQAGEFRGLLEPGTHWYFDPLDRTKVEIVSRRLPFLQHEKLDLIVKSGELKGRAQVFDLEDSQRALVWIDGRFADLRAGPVRLLDRPAGGSCRSRRYPPAAVRARGPEGHRADAVGRASTWRSGR